MTLEAGDAIFTGTPEAVIAGYPKDKQVWLKAGDKIMTSIESSATRRSPWSDAMRLKSAETARACMSWFEKGAGSLRLTTSNHRSAT